MILRVTPQARRHLEAIATYLSERNPVVARRARQNIRRTLQLLTRFPDIGREGALRGTREVLVPSFPYIVVHRVELTGQTKMVVILGIYHGAQLRPGQDDTPES